MIKRLQRTVIVSGCLVVSAGCQQPLKVGSVAPDFSGVTDEGEVVKLSDLMGNRGVVLYFYPKGETLGCVTQACAFRDRLGRLYEKGYAVTGIRCDSVDSPRAYKARQELPFTLITDSDGAIARRFDVPLEHKMLGDTPSLLIDRQTFVIDKERRITQQFKVEDPEERVRKTVEKLGVPFD